MGLLDDAIREHLDLKRRRGADPAEVERAEQEALGPVRRGPLEAEPPELVLDEDHEPEWDDLYEAEHDAPVAEEADAGVAFVAPDAPLEPRPGLAPEPFYDEDDPFGDQGPPLETEPPLPAGQLGETVEYDVEEALDEPLDEPAQHAEPPAEPPPAAPAPGTPDEDPLEETPEFLQETPDHDRLWFEQRPPRDFDFDG